MPPKKRTRTVTEEQQKKTTQRVIGTKRGQARRLLQSEVEENEAKAVSLLEECVAQGDLDAMPILAKCYAFALGTHFDPERAMKLISEATKRGNDEALFLMKLGKDWKDGLLNWDGLKFKLCD